MGLEKRFWLSGHEDDTLKRLLCGTWQDQETQPEGIGETERQEIRRLCESSVAVRSWVAGAFRVGMSRMELDKRAAFSRASGDTTERERKVIARQVVTETRREAERRGYQSLALGLAEELRVLN